MNITKFKQALELMKLLENESPEEDNSDYPLVGQYVIVRTYSAGVFAGIFEKRLPDKKILLKDCRRLWRWHTANNGVSLSEIAIYGLNPLHSKICCVEPFKIVEDIEISPATEISRKSIEEAIVYVAS